MSVHDAIGSSFATSRPARPGTAGAQTMCCCSATVLPSPGGDVVILRISGEVDLATRPLVSESLDALLARRPAHLMVDLAGLVFCDVSGLALLVRAGASATARGVGYSISAPTRQAGRVWGMLWSEDERPVRHPTAAVAVLVAMADIRRSDQAPLSPDAPPSDARAACRGRRRR